MTLASDDKPTTPDRSGASQKQLHRENVSDTLPPTLLRLPNLDPLPPPAAAVAEPELESSHPAAPQPETRQPEIAAPNLGARQSATSNPAPPAQPAGSSRQAQELERPSSPQSQPTPPAPHLGSTPTPPQPAVAVVATPVEANASAAASWMTHFASRKTLAALLLLIAALAVFLPRSSEPALDAPAAELAKSDQPPTPASIAPAAGPEESHHPADPVASQNSKHASAHASGAADEEPTDTAYSELNAPITPSTAMIQQPDSDQPPSDAALPQRAFHSQLASTPGSPATPGNLGGRSEDDNSPLGPPAQLDTPFPSPPDTADFDATDDSDVAARLATSANDEIRRMDAAHAAARQPHEQNLPVAAEPDFVLSRTPHPITNWADYLPSVDLSSVAAPSGTSQPTLAAPLGESARSTGMPGEPDFRFALPDDSVPGMSQHDNDAAAQSVPPQGPTSAAPEARIAMPPAAGYPGPGGFNR